MKRRADWLTYAEKGGEDEELDDDVEEEDDLGDEVDDGQVGDGLPYAGTASGFLRVQKYDVIPEFICISLENNFVNMRSGKVSDFSAQNQVKI